MKLPDRPRMEYEPTDAAPMESTRRQFNPFGAAAIESTSLELYPSGKTRPEYPAVNNQGVIDCYTYLIDATYLLT